MRLPLVKPPETIAELLYRLGDVPPERVLFTPLPGTATVADLIAADKPVCELIDGTLVRKPADFAAAQLSAFLGSELFPAVTATNLGILTNTLAPIRLETNVVRSPDLAFTPWTRMPGGRMSSDPVPSVIPTLAVDFFRPGNTRAEMTRKRSDYWMAGIDVWWLINSRKRTVRVYSPQGDSRLLTAADTLDGGTVLPGFALPVADLFAELDRHG